MNAALEIWNDDCHGCRLVGRMYVNPGRGPSGVHLAFIYEATWLATPHAFAIDPTTLPLATAPFHSNDLFPALSDTGPDRWGCLLIERQPSLRNRQLTSIDYLLGLADQTRIGSLRYRWADSSAYLAATQNPVPPLLTLGRLLQATDAVQAGRERLDDLALLLGSGSPPGGARPKATVLDRDGSLTIAKFPRGNHEDPRSIAKGEVLALSLARQAGIRTAQARLVTVKHRDVAIIQRFDRRGSVRIPFISARTLLGATTDQTGSYVEIAEAIRRFGAHPQPDLTELWRRLVFGRLIANCDDHLRNHAFLRDASGDWLLAPAFDLNPVPAHERRQHMATPVAPGRPGGIETALELCPAFGLTLRQARRELARGLAAVAAWERSPLLNRKDRQDYASAFENEERALAQKILAPKLAVGSPAASLFTARAATKAETLK